VVASHPSNSEGGLPAVDAEATDVGHLSGDERLGAISRGPGASGPIPNFFQLPSLPFGPHKRRRHEPVVDYSKSIIMTNKEYVKAMEVKAHQKEEAAKEKERKRQEVEQSKEKRAEERSLKATAALQ
jgi:hypothetical protein